MQHIISSWVDIWPEGSANSAEGHYVAIADVHGRADLLAAMSNVISGETPDEAMPVLLGDLIDRGPESLRTLDIAIEGIAGRDGVNIAGNHESLVRCALDSNFPRRSRIWDDWRSSGGDALLSEVGLGMIFDPLGLQEALGWERFAFIMSMTSNFLAGQVLFAHAGVNPHVSVRSQLVQPVDDVLGVMNFGDYHRSMRWIRQPWVGHDMVLDDEDFFVIYGHTVIHDGRPLVTRCQAGIDLGSALYGRLCAVEVENTRMRFITVGEDLDPRLSDPSTFRTRAWVKPRIRASAGGPKMNGDNE